MTLLGKIVHSHQNEHIWMRKKNETKTRNMEKIKQKKRKEWERK